MFHDSIKRLRWSYVGLRINLFAWERGGEMLVVRMVSSRMRGSGLILTHPNLFNQNNLFEI